MQCCKTFKFLTVENFFAKTLQENVGQSEREQFVPKESKETE